MPTATKTVTELRDIGGAACIGEETVMADAVSFTY